MMLHSEKSIALLTVILVILALVMLSSAMLSLLSSHTRLVEHDISRTKSKCALEGAMVRQLDRLRRTYSSDTTHDVSGRYDQNTTYWTVGVSNSTIGDLFQINLSVDYTTTF